jgi:hypothetical protein
MRRVVEILPDLTRREVVDLIIEHYVGRLDNRLRLVLELRQSDEGDAGLIEVLRIESMDLLPTAVGDMVMRTVSEEEQSLEHHLQRVRNARERNLVTPDLS